MLKKSQYLSSFASAAVIGLGLFLQPSAVLAKSDVNIIAAHVVSTDTTQQEMYETFKRLVYEKSDGRINVEIYPNGQLGGERVMVESVQAGGIQITSPSVGVLGNFSPVLDIFGFPFMFSDRESVYSVLDGKVGQNLLKRLDSNGLKALAYSENGWRQLNTVEGPVSTPADIQGLKIRTMQVPMHIAFWKQIGANPTPMAFTEVFNGLAQGVVDGEENPLQLIYTSKFYEPAPYITLTNHIFDPEIVVINKQFFDQLSTEDQDIIQTSLDQAIEHLRELNRDLDEDLKKKLEDQGVTITELTDDERAAWVDSVIPFYKAHASDVDRDILIDVLEAADNQKLLDVVLQGS